jgi:polygalacturonase
MIFNVKDFGAVGDGKAIDSFAIQKAIDACAVSGGGTVVCPAGNYLSGTMELKSHVELHLMSGSVLTSCLDPQYFHLPADSTGSGEMFALIAASHAEDIVLSGEGSIDGCCMSFMHDDQENGGNGEEHLTLDDLRRFRPKLLRFEDVRNATIKDATFKNSAFWTIHLAACEDCRITNIRVDNPLRACNTDAIDIDCCKDIIVSGCLLKTGDDGVCVKSTAALAKRYGACERVNVCDCIVHSTSAALKIGTETFGDIRDILFSNCQVHGSSHALAVYSRDGGNVENIRFSNIMGNAKRHGNAPRHKHGWEWWGKGDAIFVSAVKRGEGFREPGAMRNICFEGVSIDCEASAYISAGSEGAVVEDVSIANCKLRFIRQGSQPTGVFDEQPSFRRPQPHEIPGVFIEKADGVDISNLKIEWVKPEGEQWTGALEVERCGKVSIFNVKTASMPSGHSLLKTTDSEVEIR